MTMKGGSGVIYTNDPEERGGMTLENPFSFKVGQVFTGFGVGCGIGIGVGRPLNLGAIPVLNQVMVAARGATDAFSGVQVHVNNSLRKVGAKNIEAGIGCGVGFGHGFGVGLAVKPSVLHHIQSQAAQVVSQVMKKIGLGSSSSAVHQSILPASLQTGMNMVKEPSHENPQGGVSQLVKSVSNNINEGSSMDGKAAVSSGDNLTLKNTGLNTQYSSRTETVLNNFLKNPILREEVKGSSSLHEQGVSLQLLDKVLQMVLKHQLLIDELMQENERLRQILVEDLKVRPDKLQLTFKSSSKSTCAECFECRRKQRRR